MVKKKRKKIQGSHDIHIVRLLKQRLRLHDNTNLQERYEGQGRLTRLSLAYLDLSQWPAELGQLIHVQALNLFSTRLTTIPVELSQLTNLRKLDLSGNQLTTIPAELSRLTRLQELDLSGNQLTTIPLELGQLANVRKLYLEENRLPVIPAELGQLTTLQELDLSGNQLTTIPAELGQLINLQRLDLSGNPLSTEPPKLGQLPHFHQLSTLAGEGQKIARGQEQLTRAQEAYARQFAEVRIAALFSTEEIDERKAEEHLRKAYQVTGLEAPCIRWFDSPLLFFLAYFSFSLSEEDARWDNVRQDPDLFVKYPAQLSEWETLWDNVRLIVQHALKGLVEEDSIPQEPVGDSFLTDVNPVGGSDSVEDPKGDAWWPGPDIDITMHAFCNPMIPYPCDGYAPRVQASSLGDGVWDKVRVMVRDGVQTNVLLRGIRNIVGGEVYDNVEASIGESAMHSLQDVVFDNWLRGTEAYTYEGRLAWAWFCHEVFEANDLIHLARFNEMVSGFCLGSKGAWLVRKPIFFERDSLGRLHSERGKALRYPDGWGCYAWHGVGVPEKLILHPEQITREDWLQEDNQEVRRAIAERLGHERFVELVGATCIDQGQRGTLVEVDLGDDPERAARYVHVKDSSTERQYYLRVPPSISSADEAVAWTFDLDEREYRPVQEA